MTAPFKVYVINFNRRQVAAKDFPSERIVVGDYTVRTKRERENQLKYINSLVALSKYHCPALMNRPSTFLHSSVSGIDFHWSTIVYLLFLWNYYSHSLSESARNRITSNTRRCVSAIFIVTRTSHAFFRRLLTFCFIPQNFKKENKRYF